MCNPERFWRKKYKHSQPPVDIFGAQHFAKKNFHFHFPPPPHQSLGFFARLRNIFLKKRRSLEGRIGLPASHRFKRDNSPGWRRSRLPLILLQQLQYWWHDARCTHINDMHIAHRSCWQLLSAIHLLDLKSHRSSMKSFHSQHLGRPRLWV